jgi:hypothetical protein
MEGLLRKYLRINRSEEEELEDLDRDGSKMLEIIYGRQSLKYCDRRQSAGNKGRL